MNLKFNIMKELESEIKELESRLESFDWYFHMADDFRKYTAGSLEYNRLQEYMKSLPDQEVVVDLYNKHCPWGKE